MSLPFIGMVHTVWMLLVRERWTLSSSWWRRVDAALDSCAGQWERSRWTSSQPWTNRSWSLIGRSNALWVVWIAQRSSLWEWMAPHWVPCTATVLFALICSKSEDQPEKKSTASPELAAKYEVVEFIGALFPLSYFNTLASTLLTSTLSLQRSHFNTITSTFSLQHYHFDALTSTHLSLIARGLRRNTLTGYFVPRYANESIYLCVWFETNSYVLSILVAWEMLPNALLPIRRGSIWNHESWKWRTCGGD